MLDEVFVNECGYTLRAEVSGSMGHVPEPVQLWHCAVSFFVCLLAELCPKLQEGLRCKEELVCITLGEKTVALVVVQQVYHTHQALECIGHPTIML